jgi:hypothetical protein
VVALTLCLVQFYELSFSSVACTLYALWDPSTYSLLPNPLLGGHFKMIIFVCVCVCVCIVVYICELVCSVYLVNTWAHTCGGQRLASNVSFNLYPQGLNLELANPGQGAPKICYLSLPPQC